MKPTPELIKMRRPVEFTRGRRGGYRLKAPVWLVPAVLALIVMLLGGLSASIGVKP